MTAPSVDTPAAEQAAAVSLCQRPVPLQNEVLRRRIYSPQSYAPVRNVSVVPVTYSECTALASWFPLVWRRQRQGIEFVAVRALVDDQHAQPKPARGHLPLILRAYPFILDPSDPIGPNARRMMDDVFADAPTDVGATITTLQHRLSRGTIARFRFLDRFAREFPAVVEIGEAIATLDEFEPWPLKFDIDGHRIDVPDLMVIRPSAFESGRFAPLLERFGTPCGTMLGLHRISIFRAGGLLALARALFKDRGGAGPATGEARADTGKDGIAREQTLILS